MNGTPKGFFHSSRGLRQGDLLSPFFIIMITEAYRRMVHNAETSVLIKGWRVGSSGPSIPLFRFANNSHLFLSALMYQVQNSKCILLIFEATSILKTNLHKSKIMEVSEVPNLGCSASMLGFLSATLPCLYLGLPWSANCKSKSLWGLVVERIER